MQTDPYSPASASDKPRYGNQAWLARTGVTLMPINRDVSSSLAMVAACRKGTDCFLLPKAQDRTLFVSIFRGTRAFIQGLCMRRIVYGRPHSWLRDLQNLVSVAHRSTSVDPPDVCCVDVGVSRKTLAWRKRVSEMVAVRIDAGSNDAASWQPGEKDELGADNLRLSPCFRGHAESILTGSCRVPVPSNVSLPSQLCAQDFGFP